MAVADDVSREKFFSMLEKAVRPQFFMLITSFLIFADCALVHFAGFGIRDVEKSAGGFNVSLALTLLLIFVAFSGFASMALPSVMVPALMFYIDVKYQVWLLFYKFKRHWFGSEAPPVRARQRAHNRVTLKEILDAAHEGENTFLMDLYKEYDATRRRADADLRELQKYAFCALVSLIFNYWLLGVNSDHAITHWVVEYYASSLPVWMAIGFLLWLVLLPVHHYDSEGQWIYCPPLYQKLEAEEDMRRKEEAEWRRKIGIKREFE